ncbi:gallidermin family lantibiotic [Amycolatopsis sp. NPDC004772]
MTTAVPEDELFDLDVHVEEHRTEAEPLVDGTHILCTPGCPTVRPTVFCP